MQKKSELCKKMVQFELEGCTNEIMKYVVIFIKKFFVFTLYFVRTKNVGNFYLIEL